MEWEQLYSFKMFSLFNEVWNERKKNPLSNCLVSFCSSIGICPQWALHTDNIKGFRQRNKTCLSSKAQWVVRWRAERKQSKEDPLPSFLSHVCSFHSLYILSLISRDSPTISHEVCVTEKRTFCLPSVYLFLCRWSLFSSLEWRDWNLWQVMQETDAQNERKKATVREDLSDKTMESLLSQAKNFLSFSCKRGPWVILCNNCSWKGTALCFFRQLHLLSVVCGQWSFVSDKDSKIPSVSWQERRVTTGDSQRRPKWEISTKINDLRELGFEFFFSSLNNRLSFKGNKKLSSSLRREFLTWIKMDYMLVVGGNEQGYEEREGGYERRRRNPGLKFDDSLKRKNCKQRKKRRTKKSEKKREETWGMRISFFSPHLVFLQDSLLFLLTLLVISRQRRYTQRKTDIRRKKRIFLRK